MRASIIVPVFNQARYLEEAINSALNQTHRDTEVIVVDDGSTDNSYDIARRFGKSITVLRQKNQGVPLARNAGAKISRGEFLLFLDSDDWIDREYLDKTIPLMTEGVGVVSTYMQYFGEKDNLIPPLGMTIEVEADSNQLPITSLIRREAFPGYNSFPMIFGMEDWDLWLGIMEGGWKVVALNEALFHYRVHSDSMCGKETAKHREDTIAAVKFLHAESCRKAGGFHSSVIYTEPTKRFLIEVLDERLIEKNGKYVYLIEKYARQLQAAGKAKIVMEQ
jgi:glycosyltransferase involved in cell wall biosynthesis